ncbi:MAG: GntP family permease [Bacteroidota bacterium]
MLLSLIGLSILLIIFATVYLNWHPAWALLMACLLVGWGSGQDMTLLFMTIGTGFGSLLGKIGLIIVFGAILGVTLEKTGGAVTLADALIGTLGKRFPALTMAVVGAVVSIPVFCDSGFIILSRLNRRLAKRTGISPASLFLALAAGLYLTHNLVPPTPGPVTAAANLEASQHLGSIILLGLLVSLPVLLVAWWWSRWQGKQITLAEASAEEVELDHTPPPLWRVLPSLLVPILLLAFGTVWQDNPIWQVLGQAPVALLLGVLFGFVLLAWPKREQWSAWTAQGIQLAGPILFITGLGGSFGAILVASGVEKVVRELFSDVGGSGSFLLLSAFLLAAILKTAQGSSTSALVVSSAVLAPVVEAVGFTDPLALSLLVTTIGSGAMAISHANDSYFWVVTQFSDFSLQDAYRSYSVMTFLMGLTGLLTCLLLNFLLLT